MKGSLRRQRDSQLEEPYRSWINGEVLLPEEVTILPRKIDVQSEAMLLFAVVLGCAILAFFFLPGPLKSISSDPSTDSFLTVVLLGSVVVFLPYLTIRRLYTTLAALREQRYGKLRQGIIVGPAGVLIRLTANKCFVIPLESFVRAKPWAGSEAGNEEFICIETKNGNFDFSERSLVADADAVNQLVFKVRVSRSSDAKNQKGGKGVRSRIRSLARLGSSEQARFLRQ